MKIAREIAEATAPNLPHMEQLIQANAITIAAKLEPVRDALSDLIRTCTSSDVMEFGELPDREAIRNAEAALTLLKEE